MAAGLKPEAEADQNLLLMERSRRCNRDDGCRLGIGGATVSFRALAFLLCFALGGTGTAAAACTQADLQGVWDAYSTATSEFGLYWTACVVRIAAGGAIRSGTGCAAIDGSRSAVSGGRLTLQRSCRASGFLTQRFGQVSVRNGVQATLTRDKNLLIGVGVTPSGAGFTFQAVKR